MSVWSEYSSFFREFRRDFHHTGSIVPSGGPLARALARPLCGPRPPGRILEVGPGTGSVTRAIVAQMQAVDCVEINPHFARLLRQKLESDPALAPRQADVQVLQSAVQDVPGEAVYDFIISGLPLNNFTAEEVRGVLAAFGRLIRPGGTLAYFEYLLIRQLKTPFVGRAERCRLAEVGQVVGEYIRAHEVGRERVFLNVPPAVVRRLQPRPAPCEPAGQAVS
jgi:phospholipid N-methyltransferase